MVVPALSIQGRAGSGPPGLLSSAQSLAFHSVEFKFPFKLMLPEQHSPFFVTLTCVVPASEGGSGAEELDLVLALGGAQLQCSGKNLHFRWSLNLKASSSSNFETCLCDAAS